MPPCRLARPGSLTRGCRSAGPTRSRTLVPTQKPSLGATCCTRTLAPARSCRRTGKAEVSRSTTGSPDPLMSACDPRSWRPARRWSVSAWPSALCGIGRQELGGQERADHQRPGAGDGGLAWMVMDGHGASLAPSTGLTRPSGRKPASVRRRSVRGLLKARTPCSRAGALRHRGRADGGDPRPTRRRGPTGSGRSAGRWRGWPGDS